MAGLIQAAGLETCCLAGHDWGAAVAWEMAQPSCDPCEQGELLVFEDASYWVQHD